MDAEGPAHDFDGYWKFALDRYLGRLVALVSTEVADAIEWDSPIESLDKEFLPLAIDGADGRRFVDTLVRVRLRKGGDAVLLVHVEVQSERDDAFEWRMFAYWFRIKERYAQPVLSIAVLADDDPLWRPVAFTAAVFTTRARFEFTCIKLTDFEASINAFMASDDPLLVLIAVDRMTRRTRYSADVRCIEKTRLVRMLLRNRSLRRVEVLLLIRLLTRLMVLPQNLERRFIDDVRRAEGAMSDYGFLNTLTPWETVALEKGLERGRVEELRALTLRVVRTRFGLEPSAESALRERLDRHADENRLAQVFDAAVIAPTHHEFAIQVETLLAE